jgi:molybdopterin adenylyltransferase
MLLGLFSHHLGVSIPVCTIENVTQKRQYPSAYPAVVITVSDSCARGLREDLSGPAVTKVLEAGGFETVAAVTVADEQPAIEDALRRAAAHARLIVTTGGTGIAARDVTPEATRAICDRLIEGVAELVRAEGRRTTALAALSRGVCGILGRSIILNVPGKPQAAASSLRVALPVLPHALELLEGHTEHTEPAAKPKAKPDTRRKPGKVARS